MSSRKLTPQEKKLLKDSKHKTDATRNPFEDIKQRRKMDILGTKKQEVHLSKQRSRAIQERKDTLLRDMYKKQRANKFVDKRNQEEEQKTHRTLRQASTRFRQKHNRFNLQDDDDDTRLFDTNLSHDDFEPQPQRNSLLQEATLGDVDSRVNNTWLKDDYDPAAEERALMDEIMSQPPKKKQRLMMQHDPQNDIYIEPKKQPQQQFKTHREVMEEVIAKSKLAKKAKKMKRNEQEKSIENLDDEFKDLLPLLNVRNRHTNVVEKHEPADDYDKAVSALAMDPRVEPARPVKQQQEAVTKASENEKSGSDEIIATSDENAPIRSKNADISTSGDFLGDDDYMEDEENPEDISDGEEPMMGDAAEDDDEDAAGEEEEEQFEQETKQPPTKPAQQQVANQIVTVVPNTFEEFCQVLDAAATQSALVRAIVDMRGSLTKLKLTKHEKLLSFLLRYFEKEASHAVIPQGRLNVLNEHLFELSVHLPEYSTDEFDKLVRKLMERLQARLANVSASMDGTVKSDEESQFPNKQDLLLAKLVSNIFPVQLANGARVLAYLNHVISSCMVLSVQDIGKGLLVSVFIYNVRALIRSI